MSVAVTPRDFPAGGVDAGRVVSPELALVDPGLAAEERMRLPAGAPVLGGGSGRGSRSEARIALRPVVSVADGHVLRHVHEALARYGAHRIAVVAAGCAFALALLSAGVHSNRTPAAPEAVGDLPPAETAPTEETKPPPVSQDERTTSAAPLEERAPAAQTRAAVPRRFSWAPDPRADSYLIEIFRGSARVFVATSGRAEVTVPAQWTLAGKRQRLTKGEYRWYVWPVTAGTRAANAIVQATVSVP